MSRLVLPPKQCLPYQGCSLTLDEIPGADRQGRTCAKRCQLSHLSHLIPVLYSPLHRSGSTQILSACARCCGWWKTTWGTRRGWDDGDDSGGGGGSSSNDAAEADRRFWLRRFVWGALFAVPTFLLAMVRCYLTCCLLGRLSSVNVLTLLHRMSNPVLLNRPPNFYITCTQSRTVIHTWGSLAT